VFILTEQTPNPDALKFLPHATLTDGERRWFSSGEGSPLAERLFEIPGVRRVFIAPDFVTVTRSPEGPPWSELRYPAIAGIADHLASGEPAILDAEIADEGATGEDDVVAEILQVLADHVRPGVARDGGDVVFEGFDAETGVVWLRLEGACGGCPSSRMTLKAGIEQLLRRFVPEVARVEQVAAEPVAAPRPWKTWAQAPAKARAGVRTLFTHAGRELKRAER
jgi:Fe-S cluster biogenesis protein NfuA